ncbi:unnamed protein product [Rotaria sordida]|uniref:Uncharacterized protein n=1 Tax=Rotaria sordida TaxID=392033 RepID=A0A814PCE1_9BILA|nr:unnamed protein product [Rotaria sordida]CAF1182871.1 unnamed protein product [Rotaria sordida]CAF1190900.1 unnamed protein product [Rotaria sordida]CAF1236443.1 unnamed protein product [Rotaria sordida]CAF1445211.1 unnamed protein product [Rotaria sordida]
MNLDKSNLHSPPPYNYATIQPTNSFTNPFTSNQSSQLTVDEKENETKATLMKNDNSTSFGSFCLECMQCCAATVECLLCCFTCIQCLSECK